MDVRKRPERDCGRRTQQKRALFVSKVVTLLEPVTLVQVPKARTVGASIDGLDGVLDSIYSKSRAARRVQALRCKIHVHVTHFTARIGPTRGAPYRVLSESVYMTD